MAIIVIIIIVVIFLPMYITYCLHACYSTMSSVGQLSYFFRRIKKVREEISNFDGGGGGVANGNGKYQGILAYWW